MLRWMSNLLMFLKLDSVLCNIMLAESRNIKNKDI